MTAPIVSLVFPFPPKELSPNAPRTQHWSVKAKAAAAYKEWCLISARDARDRLIKAGAPLPLKTPVEMHVMIVMRRWSRRDWDNIAPTIKPGQDMLVQVGILSDDSCRELRPIVIDFSTGPQPKVFIHLYAPR